MDGQADTQAETRRGRVRRLLVQPLIDGGMHAKRGTDPKVTQDYLDRLCDELAYLGDEDLRVIRKWAEVNGDGARKDIWPPFVSFAGMAQSRRARPIEELPEVASWFRSRAGEEAQAVPGRLVVELRFMQAKRRPPFSPADKARLAQDAARLAADVLRARELRDCGRPYDAEVLAEFEVDEARAIALVREGQAKRAEDAA